MRGPVRGHHGVSLGVGDSPAEVSDRCGGCCLFCLSVCLSAFALAWWLVCGWLAILPLACDLRITIVPSDFFVLGYPLAFLACLGFLLGAAGLGREPVRFLLMMRR